MTKPTVVRVGERIVAVRFAVTSDNPWHQYAAIMDELPDDAATRAWRAGNQDMRIADGLAVVMAV